MSRHVLGTLVAVLLARSLAIHLHLAMPQVAMACVFIVMQPQLELVLVKSAYRLGATVAGAIVTPLLASLSSATPAGFLLALGCWVSAWTCMAAFGRQFPAYGLVLTGYTAVIIGIPVVFEPQRAGTEALMRVQEVGLGIVCASMVAALAHWRAASARDGLATADAGAGARPILPPPRAWPEALAAAAYPASAMLATGALWLATGWSGGAMATLNTTVNCALVALSPAPRTAATQLSRGMLLAVAASLAVQATALFLGPALSLWLVLVPALALGAMFTARPATTGLGLGFSITLCMLSLPAGSSASGQPGYIENAGGMLLSVVALMAISAAGERLALLSRRPCHS
jgi:uncharacterized membrane protein YccC